MKKILYLIILMLVPLNVFAATGSIKASASSSSVTINNTVTVTVKVSSTGKLGSWQFGISYDKSKLSLISGEQSVAGYGDGNISSKSYTYKFKAIAKGSASITIDNAKIADWDTESVIQTNSSNLTLNVKEPVVINYSSDNNLKSLSVDGFEISPKFDKKVLEYSVVVLPTTEKINVSAVVNDKKASVKGTGEAQVKEGVNEIDLVVTAENGTRKTYVLKVTVPEKNPVLHTFREGEYNILRKLPEVYPSNFSASTININNEEVVCLQNEKLSLTLLYLKKDDILGFYIYDEKNNSVTLYNEIEPSDFKIYLLDKEVSIDGLIKSDIEINGKLVPGYRLTKDSKNYVVSGRNVSTGKDDLYLYDVDNKTISVFSVSDYLSLSSNNNIYKFVSFGLGVCVILLIGILIIVNNGRRKVTKILKEMINKEEKIKEENSKEEKKKKSKNIEKEKTQE